MKYNISFIYSAAAAAVVIVESQLSFFNLTVEEEFGDPIKKWYTTYI